MRRQQAGALAPPGTAGAGLVAGSIGGRLYSQNLYGRVSYVICERGPRFGRGFFNLNPTV
jgi:hypothetical protein